MTKNNLNLIYALKDNQIVCITDVENGLKCKCMCPSCFSCLIAKKGTKMMHHFAHYSGKNCEYGYETSLHWAATDILSKAKKMMIPSVFIKFPNSYKHEILLKEAQEISIDKVELEKRFDSIIPDVVVYSGKRKLFVEIFVTHAIDETKLKKLREQEISTIEIDLSKIERTISPEELSDILLKDSTEKYWCYNAYSEKHLKRFYSVGDVMPIISRGFALHVDNCPIATRTWRGKPYANFIDDCLDCEYCISQDFKRGMLCSGRLRISKIEDFDIPLSERVKRSNDALSSKRDKMLANGICPNCSGNLVLREGKYGNFWGCDNYPHCRFVASIDLKTGELKIRA